MGLSQSVLLQLDSIDLHVFIFMQLVAVNIVVAHSGLGCADYSLTQSAALDFSFSRRPSGHGCDM